MTPRVRFAPSPTGRLHIGNIRTAALNWLFARKHHGTFLLRLDDTDVARSTEEFAQAIRDDLTWLGLTWDEEARQQDRTALYRNAAEALKASGVLYPCFESEDELDRRRKRQLAMHRPPIYDRAALKLSKQDIDAKLAAGETPYWRFRLPNTSDGGSLAPEPTLVSWNDLVRGDQTVDLGSLSDPVLIREDGTFLYTFTSVVDDIDFAITHVVRGEDHVTNTGVQMAIFEALGATPPAFGHHSLLVGADGHALSKRLGALSVQSFRDAGLEPMAVLCHAALVGTSDAIEPLTSRDELAAKLDFSQNFNRAGTLRRCRSQDAQRQAPAYARLRRCSRASQGLWRCRRRRLLDRGARQSRGARRCAALVGYRRARHRAGYRGHESRCCRRCCFARRAVG